MAFQTFSPVDEEEYHPSQGRFMHNKHLKNEIINLNKLRSHDALVGHFKAERSTQKSTSSHNISGGSNVVPTAVGIYHNKTCNCNSTQSHSYPFSSLRDEIGDLFSIIILTYNRTDLLLRLLNHYSAMPHLERIIVVWNSQEMAPPIDEWTQLGPHPVPVQFKAQQENRLRNRLQLFPEIKSSG